MSALTAERVQAVVTDSLYTDEEVPDSETVEPEDLPAGTILIEGILHRYAFHPRRLETHREEVRAMIAELPVEFLRHDPDAEPSSTGGGGWSFLNLCNRADGTQWAGLHMTMEMLCCVAIGLGLAKWLLPSEYWGTLPGGMPYVVFTP